jgi:hypothetical protein
LANLDIGERHKRGYRQIDTRKDTRFFSDCHRTEAKDYERKNQEERGEEGRKRKTAKTSEAA